MSYANLAAVFSVLFFIFFFSSRRRHTRCSRDWSSDVCSSDLRDAVALEEHVLRPAQPDAFGAELPGAPRVGRGVGVGARSEEHTSELQSRLHLVCRLLLEKKKKRNKVESA